MRQLQLELAYIEEFLRRPSISDEDRLAAEQDREVVLHLIAWETPDPNQPVPQYS